MSSIHDFYPNGMITDYTGIIQVLSSKMAFYQIDGSAGRIGKA